MSHQYISLWVNNTICNMLRETYTYTHALRVSAKPNCKKKIGKLRIEDSINMHQANMQAIGNAQSSCLGKPLQG